MTRSFEGLLELPGNRGQIFAIDPYRVTGVQAFRSTLPGRGAQLFDMTTVWLDNRTIFVCSWKLRDTLAKIQEARAAGFEAWASGYRTAAAIPWEEPGVPSMEDVRADFATWMNEIGSAEPEAEPEVPPEDAELAS